MDIEKPTHVEEKELYGAAQWCGNDWYWWDREWLEHGPYDSEEAAERARLSHPDFAVEPNTLGGVVARGILGL